MRRLVIMVSILLAGCGGGDVATTPTGGTTPKTVDVFTPGNVFSPFSTTIAVGGTVRFNIAGAADGHNVIFKKTVAGVPADINVVVTAVVSRTFNSRGTFPFDCLVHPGMSGEIVVQ